MSYSQHKEDEYIVSLIKRYDIFPLVIDVGAGDGLMFSNSRLLIEEHGFKGILFEPSPEPYKDLEKLYDGTDIECINRGIADAEFYYTIKTETPRGNHWTLHSIQMGESKNKSIRLSQFLYDRKIEEVGVLSVDTEGFDTRIIRDLMTFSKVRPEIIVIETDANASLDEQIEILSDYSLICNTSSYNHIFQRMNTPLKDIPELNYDLHDPRRL